MPENRQPSRSLSEISHLFLSDIRERQGHGAAVPRRQPPAARQVSIDLTPEEFEQAAGEAAAPSSGPARTGRGIVALVGSHLAQQSQWARAYARHVALAAGRTALIEVDAAELKIICFDPSVTPESAAADGHGESAPTEPLDARRMAQAIEELAWDIDCWLLSIPNPRTSEARALFRMSDKWVLLSTGDREGVVAGYRALKGLAEQHNPPIALAVLDAPNDAAAQAVHQKLSDVCRQFLGCDLESEPRVRPAHDVAEQVVLHCHSTQDKAQLAAAPQWQVLGDFLAGMNQNHKTSQEPAPEALVGSGNSIHSDGAVEPEDPFVAGATRAPQRPTGLIAAAMQDSVPALGEVAAGPVPIIAAQPVESTDSAKAPPEIAPYEIAGSAAAVASAKQSISNSPVAPVEKPVSGGSDDVIDLPAADSPESAILAAVAGQGNAYICCPVRAPQCAGAQVAVSRERQLTLLAVAGKGLADLRRIAAGYRWLQENRALIAMALPQFAIAADAPACLRLLVDQADMSADVLQPLLFSSTVTVQAYRRLRWGNRNGLLLEAA
jgi:hypothetical protein